MAIEAKIIADSRNEFGNRLTTFIVKFPRIVLAEFNTHRMFSRNSASSRAIPFEKMLKMVEEDPFIPIKWMKDHKGMQGSQYFESEYCINKATEIWLEARDEAISKAKRLANMQDPDNLGEAGVTKQICNRLLEPFMWHTVIVTASEWQNFFALRAHDAAEIHIQDLAYKMLEEYNNSIPKQLKAGEWHIPFGDKIDYERLGRDTSEYYKQNPDEIVDVNKWLTKISTARCARVSYLNFEGKDDYLADIKLHDSLLNAGHMSPFEHCAQTMDNGGRSGNFRGFRQYRKTIEGENKLDNRVKKPYDKTT